MSGDLAALMKALRELDILARDLSTASYERGFADASYTDRDEHEAAVTDELRALRAYLDALFDLQTELRNSRER